MGENSRRKRGRGVGQKPERTDHKMCGISRIGRIGERRE